MVKNLYIFLHVFLLVSLTSLVQHIHATEYIITNNVPNTPGGKLFDTQIGVNYTRLTMGVIQKFIYKVFEQRPDEARDVPVLNLYISDFKGYAYRSGDNIYISGPALDQFYYPRNMSKFYFSSVMYHEMTHVFQWHGGNFTAPRGLTEGIAHYVMVKSNIYEKEKYPPPGVGKRWDEGYAVTQRFLEYCDSLRKGFTPTLNKKMRYAYSDHYFVELLGKSVDQLWKDYKAKYGNKPEEASHEAFGHFPGIKCNGDRVGLYEYAFNP